MQVNIAIDEFIRSCSSRLAANTVRIYSTNLRKFAEWLGQGRELGQLSNRDVESFLISMKSNYSEKTQDNYANALRTFFRHWFAHRQCNVAWELIRGPRVPEKFPNFITPEQFDAIDRCFNEEEYYQLTKKLIFHLLWNTGMRIGELLSMNISDIDSKQHCAYVLTEKSKKLRLVMWDDRCHELLLRYLGTRLCMNRAPELFQTPQATRNQSKRTRLTSRSVQRWCAQLERELNFVIHPHAFRHGKCHYIIANGGSRHHVQAIAGHSSITSSEVYTRLNYEEQVKLQEQFLPNRRAHRTRTPSQFVLLH
jgi:site-specific recombinase XerD